MKACGEGREQLTIDQVSQRRGRTADQSGSEGRQPRRRAEVGHGQIDAIEAVGLWINASD